MILDYEIEANVRCCKRKHKKCFKVVQSRDAGANRNKCSDRNKNTNTKMYESPCENLPQILCLFLVVYE